MLRNALDGLTVIDFTHIGAGLTCTMLMVDMGARVRLRRCRHRATAPRGGHQLLLS